MKDALRPVSAPISLEKLTYDSIKKAIVSFQLVPVKVWLKVNSLHAWE